MLDLQCVTTQVPPAPLVRPRGWPTTQGVIDMADTAPTLPRDRGPSVDDLVAIRHHRHRERIGPFPSVDHLIAATEDIHLGVGIGYLALTTVQPRAIGEWSDRARRYSTDFDYSQFVEYEDANGNAEQLACEFYWRLGLLAGAAVTNSDPEATDAISVAWMVAEAAKSTDESGYGYDMLAKWDKKHPQNGTGWRNDIERRSRTRSRSRRRSSGDLQC